MKNIIFVQIASYRDPELIPTIQDCISKAKFPDNLRFGICWQHTTEDTWDNLTEYFYNPNFKILSLDYNESKGACWARHHVQKLWNGEEFSLQLDSHHRFVQDWDELLLNIWTSLDDPTAILTGYPPSYFPHLPEEKWDHIPQICNVYAFHGTHIASRPKAVPDWQTRTVPYKALQVSAGFIFGPGEINKVVPYDPELYFTGEEANLAIRYFTHGYNLYHPHKLITHHYYTRPNNKKHWTDHSGWGALSSTANHRLDCLLGRNNNFDLKEYGLGSVRTLEDFKLYSGIDYENLIIHEDTLNGLEPPCSNSEIGWDNNIKTFKEIITWDYDAIPKCEDPRFWGVFVCDQNKKALFRVDIENWKNPEIISGEVSSWSVEFTYKHRFETPKYILIWPYSESKKWIDNIYLPLTIK